MASSSRTAPKINIIPAISKKTMDFPDIWFLMETKNSDDVVLEKRKWMDYASHKLVPPHNHGGGGLALFWRQELDVEILLSCDSFIDSVITYKKKRFYATGSLITQREEGFGTPLLT